MKAFVWPQRITSVIEANNIVEQAELYGRITGQYEALLTMFTKGLQESSRVSSEYFGIR